MAHAEPLKKLLNKIAVEQEYKNHEIIIKEISSGGANYTSKIFTAVIKGTNKEDLHLFAKVAAIGEIFRNEVPVQIFDTEDFVYTKLTKLYRTIEEENNVPEEHRLVFTKYYGSDRTKYQEVLVLENLVVQGYQSHDRFLSFDWPYASSAVEKMAKFHALSLAYREKYPEKFEKLVNTLRIEINVQPFLALESALKVVKPENKEALSKFFDKYPGNLFINFFKPIVCPVLIHMDFRGSNLLHKVRADGKVDIKIVDLQTVQGGCPVSDLLYFIFTGSDEKFRAQYYDKLIDHYYTQLCEAMKRLNLNPDKLYSRADFDHEYKEKLPYSLCMAVLFLPIVTVDAENAPKVDDNLELSSFTVENPNELYVDRINGVVNDFVKWGILK